MIFYLSTKPYGSPLGMGTIPENKPARREGIGLNFVSKKILVIDDEPDLVKLVAHHLQREGFEPICVSSGSDGIHQVALEPVALIILDLMMPGEDGFQVCRKLRNKPETATLPIIILTAKDDESDKVIGLEMGADDYITKPFSVKELMARVKALLRRSKRTEPQALAVHNYKGITLDSARHEVKFSGEAVTLTAKEFSLLEHLLQNKGKVLSRELLLSSVWGYGPVTNTRTVDVHIRRLRKKIPLLDDAIITVPVLGYKMADEGFAPS